MLRWVQCGGDSEYDLTFTNKNAQSCASLRKACVFASNVSRVTVTRMMSKVPHHHAKHLLAIHQPPISSITTLSEDEIVSKPKGELIKALLQAREEVHAITQENQGLTQEIHVLTQALAVNGRDLGLEQDSDLRSVLLYDLALSQQARATLAIDLARRTEKLKSLQKTVSTLSFVREANNLELLKCERRIKELEQQVANQQAQVSTAAQSQEKLTSLIAAHHQLSEQLTAAQLRTASAERERDHLSAQIPRITLLAQDAESIRAQHQQQLDVLRTQHAQQLDALREQHKQQMETAQEQHTRREQYAQREVERYQQQLSSLRDQIEGEQTLRDKREQQGRKDTEQLTKHHEQELERVRAQAELANAAAEKESARVRVDHEIEKGKLQERITEIMKETEKLKEEISQLKNREGDAQGKIALLRAEYARQGRMNSFQEVVGAQMANVRTQLDEAKQMYSRVNAENALLAAENARLLVLLDEEIKSKNAAVFARSTSPHHSRPSTPSLMRASSFVDTFTPSSLKIPPGSSPLATPTRPASAPNLNFLASPSSSPEVPRKQKTKSKSTSSSNPTSRSSTPEPSSDTLSSSSDFSQLTSDNHSSTRSTSPIPIKLKSPAKRSPLLTRRAALRASSPARSTSPLPSSDANTSLPSSPSTPQKESPQFIGSNPLTLPSPPSILHKKTNSPTSSSPLSHQISFSSPS